jgi:hypothetical protein
MKTELLKLRNELKSAQLIVRLLQEERNNQSSDQRNFYNLSNSVEEEMNQSQLAVTENDREWKQVPNRKNTPNLLNKNLPILKQQNIPIVVSTNRYEQWSDNQGRCVNGKISGPSKFARRFMKSYRIFIIGDSHVRGCSEKLVNSLGKDFRVIGITKPNANVSAILNSMNLKDDKLSKSDVVIFCSSSRDIAKNESSLGLRLISNFVKKRILM